MVAEIRTYIVKMTRSRLKKSSLHTIMKLHGRDAAYLRRFHVLIVRLLKSFLSLRLCQRYKLIRFYFVLICSCDLEGLVHVVLQYLAQIFKSV